MLFYIASALSLVEDPVRGGPSLASDTAQPLVRFFGPDYVPAQPEHSTRKTVVAPIISSKAPIEQGQDLDTIKSILAQHGLSVKLNHVEIVDPNSKTAPEQHNFAVTANHHANPQSILSTFTENQTVITTTPGASYSDDKPWFGDGFCCFEGCPPGSCPSIFASIQTGSLFTVPAADTVACPCRGHGYCCCAACPRGTCGAGTC